MYYKNNRKANTLMQITQLV